MSKLAKWITKVTLKPGEAIRVDVSKGRRVAVYEDGTVRWFKPTVVETLSVGDIDHD